MYEITKVNYKTIDVVNEDDSCGVAFVETSRQPLTPKSESEFQKFMKDRFFGIQIDAMNKALETRNEINTPRFGKYYYIIKKH